MVPQLTAVTRQTGFRIGGRLYETQVTLGAEDHLEVAADTGAFARVTCGAKSIAITGGDDSGHTFTLRVDSTRRGLGRGTLTLGPHVFTDAGVLQGMTNRLLKQVATTPGAKARVPRGLTMAAFARVFRTDRKIRLLTVGHTARKVAAKRKTYCEAICDCCAGGGWVAAWCCISCATCDVLKSELRDIYTAV